MWWQLATLTLSVLSLAVGANWISTAAMRRVRGLKAHADLVEALPDGPGRRLLIEQLDADVRRHVAELKVAALKRWFFAVSTMMATLGVTLAILLVVGGLNWFEVVDTPPVLAPALLGVTILLAAGTFLSTNITDKRFEKVMQEFEIEPDDRPADR